MAATDFQSILSLIDQEIPEGRKSLQDNYNNLEQVAKYCESNYVQAADKRKALEETKNYTTHSLASVAYQVNALAGNFLRLLDLQHAQLANMESSVNHLSQIVMIHKEKVARREIGVLTTNRTASRPLGVKSGILFPEQTERPIKYTRKPIDYSLLDEVGHGVRLREQGSSGTPRAGRSPSVSSSGSASQAPTTQPPTPPGSRQGTMSRASGNNYRAVPAPTPLQIPAPVQYPPASPPLPPPPDSGNDAFDYQQNAPLPPPQFSDDHDTRMMIAPPPEDPYAATGPGFLGPEDWVPAQYIEKVVAIYDYEADKEDELSFSENSVIYVIRMNDDGWWEGVMDGVTGLFPSNYVEPCM